MEKKELTDLRKAAPIFDAVYQMIAAVLLGAFLGLWLDRKLGTSPWLVIVGTLFGFGAGMVILLRAGFAATRQTKDRRGNKEER